MVTFSYMFAKISLHLISKSKSKQIAKSAFKIVAALSIEAFIINI